MKKFKMAIVFGVILSLFGSFLVFSEAEARAGLSLRYSAPKSGSNKKRMQTRRSYYSKKKAVKRKRNITRTSRRKISTDVSRRSTYRSRRPDTFERVRGPQITSQLSDVSQKYENITAKSIPFYISIPAELSVESDNLNWEKGSMKISGAASSIEIKAIGESCEGGELSAYHCLKDQAISYKKALQASYPTAEIKQNKTIYFRDSIVDRYKSTPGQYLKLKNASEIFVQILLLEPTGKNVWVINMRSPDTDKGFLRDERNIQKIIDSLFKKTREIKKRTVNYGKNISSMSRRNVYTRRKSSKRKNPARLESTRASKIPFHVSMPSDFSLVSDTLSEYSGQMLFRSREAEVRVLPSKQKCDDQSYSLVIKCIEENAKKFGDALRSRVSKPQTLQDENLFSQMTYDQKIKKDVGHFYLIRSGGGRERQAIFTFRDPINEYVWTVEIESPEAHGQLLNDAPKIKKVLSSVFFGDERRR